MTHAEIVRAIREANAALGDDEDRTFRIFVRTLLALPTSDPPAKPRPVSEIVRYGIPY